MVTSRVREVITLLCPAWWVTSVSGFGHPVQQEVVKQQKPPAGRYRDRHRLRARDLQGEAGGDGLLWSDEEETNW